MSELKDRMRTDLTAAIKSRDAVRSRTLRMALSAISNAEVAGTEAKELTDDDVIAVLTTEAKKRREAAVAFEDGGRAEQAAAEREEGEVLADYLPQQLTLEEIAALVSSVVDELGVAGAGPKAMGQVMGKVSPQTKGRADGAAVAAEVRRQLG